MKMIITMLLATLVLAGCDPAESQPADTGAGKSGPAAAYEGGGVFTTEFFFYT